MENCLVTKLIGSVDNQSLKKFGELKFEISVPNDITAPFLFAGTELFTAEITGDGHFYKGTYDAQTNVTTKIENVTTTAGYRISAGTSVVSIIPKYGITTVTLNPTTTNVYSDIKLNFDEFKYNTPGLSTINMGCATDSSLPNLIFDFDNVPLKDLSAMAFGGKMYGNIDCIAEALLISDGAFCNFMSAGADNKYYHGSIESFIRHLNPTMLGRAYTVEIKPAEGGDGVTLNSVKIIYTHTLNVAASGDVTIVKAADSSVLASYDKETDTFTYE